MSEHKLQLELTVNEVNSILQVLGELPSKSGAWPLIVKIRDMAESQLPDNTEEDQ